MNLNDENWLMISKFSSVNEVDETYEKSKPWINRSEALLRRTVYDKFVDKHYTLIQQLQSIGHDQLQIFIVGN